MTEPEGVPAVSPAGFRVGREEETPSTASSSGTALADAVPKLGDKLNALAETNSRLDEKVNSPSKQIDNLSKQIDGVGGDVKSYRSNVSKASLAILGVIVMGGIYVHEDLRADSYSG